MKITIRSDSVELDGYVNAVARDSKELQENGKRFIEQIEPNVFGRALKRAENILCLLDHNYDIILASVSQGNLNLREDNIGLRANLTITNPDVIEKAKKGLLRGWSFGFNPLRQRIERLANGIEHRFVEEMELFEVSIIDDKMIPAYDGTSIEERSVSEEEIQVRFMDFENAEIVTETRAEEEPQKEADSEEGKEESPQNEESTEKKVDERVTNYYKGYKERIDKLKEEI